MNVHWTEAALADLRSAEAHVARHSAQYAAGLVERIFARTGQLADFPHLDRLLEQQIDVVSVVHASRRLPRELSP